MNGQVDGLSALKGVQSKSVFKVEMPCFLPPAVGGGVMIPPDSPGQHAGRTGFASGVGTFYHPIAIFPGSTEGSLLHGSPFKVDLL